MKRRTLLVLAAVFSLAVLNLSAQSFVSPGNQWNVKLSFFFDASTEIFTIGGDTVIEETHYKIIYHSFDSLETHFYAGALREYDDRVYYRPPGATEGLLYDFTLNTGDTTYIRNYFCGDIDIPIVVEAVDSVEYEGVLRKRWTLNVMHTDWYEYWIEGIGSLSGPVYGIFNYCIVCPHWELLCFYESDVLQYMIPYGVICYVHTVDIDEHFADEKFSVSPSLFNRGEAVVVQLPPYARELKLYDAHGRLNRRIAIAGQQSIRIETGGLLPGIHILTLTTHRNSFLTRKLICR